MKIQPEHLKFIEWNPNDLGSKVRVSPFPGRRTKYAGEVGAVIGSLGVKHCGAYAILVRFDDGKVESFAPITLYPAEETPAIASREEEE